MLVLFNALLLANATPVNVGVQRQTSTADGNALSSVLSERKRRFKLNFPKGGGDDEGDEQDGDGNGNDDDSDDDDDDDSLSRFSDLDDLCFPGEATVTLRDRGPVSISSVKIGDYVHTGSGVFSPVYMFSHRIEEGSFDFVRIGFHGEQGLALSPGHLLYANDQRVTRAVDINVGDLITLGNGTMAKVDRVTYLKSTGLYNPHTLNGDIVVDGVKTTVFTSAVEPSAANGLLAPMRAFYSLFNADLTRGILHGAVPWRGFGVSFMKSLRSEL